MLLAVFSFVLPLFPAPCLITCSLRPAFVPAPVTTAFAPPSGDSGQVKVARHSRGTPHPLRGVVAKYLKRKGRM